MKRMHFQHGATLPMFTAGDQWKNKPMRVVKSYCGTGPKPIQALLGWIFAAFIVVVAVVGPPLTGQSIPTLIELRHDILMIDHEFERSSLRSSTSSFGTSTFVFDDSGGGSRNTGSRIPVRGGVA